jgi:hypothetical protein
LTTFGTLNNSQQNKQTCYYLAFLEKKKRKTKIFNLGRLPSPPLARPSQTRACFGAHLRPCSSLSLSRPAFLCPTQLVGPAHWRLSSLPLPPRAQSRHRGGRRWPTRRRQVPSETEPLLQHYPDPANTTTSRKGHNKARRGLDRGHGGHSGDPPGGVEAKTPLRQGSN